MQVYFNIKTQLDKTTFEWIINGKYNSGTSVELFKVLESAKNIISAKIFDRAKMFKEKRNFDITGKNLYEMRNLKTLQDSVEFYENYGELDNDQVNFLDQYHAGKKILCIGGPGSGKKMLKEICKKRLDRNMDEVQFSRIDYDTDAVKCYLNTTYTLNYNVVQFLNRYVYKLNMRAVFDGYRPVLIITKDAQKYIDIINKIFDMEKTTICTSLDIDKVKEFLFIIVPDFPLDGEILQYAKVFRDYPAN